MEIRALIIALCLLMGNLSYTQSIVVRSGINTIVGISPTYSQFANSYNEVFSNDLKNELSTYYAPRPGMMFSAGYNTEEFTFELEYTNTNARSSATYNSGAKRIFDLRNRGISILGRYYFWQTDKPYTFCVLVGGYMGRSTIITGFQYVDGTISYGKEKILNGEYTILQGNFPLGGGVRIPFYNGLSIFAEATYDLRIPLVKRTFNDYNHQKTLSLSDYPTGLPTDYDEYLDLQGTFEYDVEKYVVNDFHFIRFTIGLVWDIEL